MRAHLEIGESLAIHTGIDKPRDEVVRWIGRGLPFGNHLVEVGREVRRDPSQALAFGSILPAVLGRVGGLHDEVGPLGETRVIRRIDAEEMRDHRRRDWCHVVGHKVATTARDEPVEQLAAQPAGEWLYSADAMLRDRRVDDPANPAVARFRDLADELLLGRYHHSYGTETRLEHVDVLRGRQHIIVTS